MSGGPGRRNHQHLDLLAHDERRERSVLWRLVLAGGVTTVLGLARFWWWV